MIRRPPRSTLFPTRRSSDLAPDHLGELGTEPGGGVAAGGVVERRSEEHTSELQSRSDLVCRLLREKKKKKRLSTLSSAARTETGVYLTAGASCRLARLIALATHLEPRALVRRPFFF